MNWKIKITNDDINYGPKDPDELTAMVFAKDLMLKGYRRVSNAYCRVARIDRDDWLDVLAKTMNCSRADFMCVNGFGVKDNWRDHYIRCYSKDVLTVHPKVMRQIKGY